MLLAFLGQYAIYRARRYRLTRTVYRGVRFHQSGSAWRYAICALLWWGVIALTLGLAYPFAQSRLERFKMRHTFFGNLPGRFEGSGSTLLLRGLLMWMLAIVPLRHWRSCDHPAIDWSAVTSAAGADDKSGWLEASGLGGAVVLAGLTGAWLLLVDRHPLPHLSRPMVLRWWVSGFVSGMLR